MAFFNSNNSANQNGDVLTTNPSHDNNVANGQTTDNESSNVNIARMCYNFFVPLRNFVFIFYAIVLVLFIGVLITIIVVFTTKSNEMENTFKKHDEEIKKDFDSFGMPSIQDNFSDLVEGGKHVIEQAKMDSHLRDGNSTSHSSSYKVQEVTEKKFTTSGSEKSNIRTGASGKCPRNPKVSGNNTVYVGEVVDILNEAEKLDKNFDANKEAEIIDSFKLYADKYGRCYYTRDEFLKRYFAFRKNFFEIETHNADPKSTYTKGINAFADYYDSEIHNVLNLAFPEILPSLRSLQTLSFDDDTVGSHFVKNKESFDWRDQGVVSPVRSQGGCSSCWAMASAGAIDAVYNIKNKGANMVTSPQHLLDCVSDDYTCSTGGVIRRAIAYATNSPGICVEDDIPYTAKRGKCDISKCTKYVTVKNYFKVATKNMQSALKKYGPIAMGLAISKDFLQYESGIFNGRCNKTLNHALLITGYGYDEEKDSRYWIVKNSWGENWGQNGYIKISRDTNSADKFCQIDTIPFVVEI